MQTITKTITKSLVKQTNTVNKQTNAVNKQTNTFKKPWSDWEEGESNKKKPSESMKIINMDLGTTTASTSSGTNKIVVRKENPPKKRKITALTEKKVVEEIKVPLDRIKRAKIYPHQHEEEEEEGEKQKEEEEQEQEREQEQEEETDLLVFPFHEIKNANNSRKRGGGGNKKQNQEVTKYNYQNIIENCSFFVRLESGAVLSKLLKTGKKMCNKPTEAFMVFHVNKNGIEGSVRDNVTSRYFKFLIEPTSFSTFCIHAKRVDIKFVVNIDEMLVQFDMADNNSPVAIYLKRIVSVEKVNGQILEKDEDDVLIDFFFEKADGGQQQGDVTHINVQGKELEPKVLDWSAECSLIDSTLCSRSLKYKKAFWNSVQVSIDRVENRFEFAITVGSNKGSTNNCWTLRQDKGQIKDIKLNSAEAVVVDISTEGINLISELKPFWTTAHVYLFDNKLMRISTRFDNELGNGTIHYYTFGMIVNTNDQNK
jgi:hypothetical protein